MEVFEGDGHGCKAHGFFPYRKYDLVEYHGCGFEEFGHDGLSVVEDGSALSVGLLAFEEDLS